MIDLQIQEAESGPFNSDKLKQVKLSRLSN